GAPRMPPCRSRRRAVGPFRYPSECVLVEVDPDGFDLPATLTGPATVLLRLEVGVTRAGRVRAPCIHVSRDGRRLRQYFDIGAAGCQYLNVSPICRSTAVGTTVRVGLCGERMRWKSDGL